MAKTKTVFSNNKEWKIEAEAWKTNLIFYKSIGTEVTVFKRKTATSVWGTKSSNSWVKTKAKSITISNRYLIAGNTQFLNKQGTCTDSYYCSLREWAIGFFKLKIKGPVGGSGSSTSVQPNKVKDFIVLGVIGEIRVDIGHEILFAEVKAGK